MKHPQFLVGYYIGLDKDLFASSKCLQSPLTDACTNNRYKCLIMNLIKHILHNFVHHIMENVILPSNPDFISILS